MKSPTPTTALFLMAPAYGHLNPSFRVASQLRASGYRVVYACDGQLELLRHIAKQGFAINPVQSYPFGVGIDETLNADRAESYLETLLDRFTGQSRASRTADLQRLLTELRPSLIFIDAFFSTDFILLYPMLQRQPAQVVVLQTMLPTYDDDGQTPPLTSPLVRGQASQTAIRRAWNRYYRQRFWQRLWQSLKYLGQTNKRLVARAWQQNQLPQQHGLRYDKTFQVGINNLPEWILAPQALDWPNRPLQPFQRYAGSQIDTDRCEELAPVYQKFMARYADEKQQNPALKLIYASLGTVKTHLKAKPAIRFFARLIAAVAAQTNWRLVLAVGPELTDAVKAGSSAVLVQGFVPQMHLLRHCDGFVTHGGLNSVQEGLAAGVPMLLYPLNQRWNQPGNAARIAGRGCGLVGNLRRDQPADITRHLIRLLADPGFTAQAQRLGQELRESVPDILPIFFDSGEPLPQR